MEKKRWARLEAKQVFFVCYAFIELRKNAEWIAKEFKEEFKEKLHRTQVYDVIREGVTRGQIQLIPPLDEKLTQRMHDRVVNARNMWATSGRARAAHREKVIEVVSRASEVSLLPVAAAAAKTAYDVILKTYNALVAEARQRDPNFKSEEEEEEEEQELEEEQRKKKEKERIAVHVGFSGGGTTNLVARDLAERLRSDPNPPRLVIHALTSGFNVSEPENAAGSFFSYFQGIRRVAFRGLFAPPYVKAGDWDSTLELVGVRESFAEKHELHIIITAIASARDKHGELNRFMELNEEYGPQTRTILDDEEKRVGDVMYRPFSATGPITKRVGIRAVTLFEPAELVAFAAQENKAVILVVGPCGERSCRRSRSAALLPLLDEPSLDVWSHLVTDDVTAMGCVGPDLKDRKRS